jgi:SAM-dependent methyltransferase
VRSAKDHYERLLNDVYAWSVSVSGDPFERGRHWLSEYALIDASDYLDLGAGFGAHTVALLREGKNVTAVDFSAPLLEALAEAAGGHEGLRSVNDDLVAFLEGSDREWDVIVCAGDTITHLADESQVETFFASAARRLRPGGRLAVAYRDSTRFSAEGVARFVFVGADARRTMHCLLEPISATRLLVTDIVTDLEPEGPRTRISDYQKLRISSAQLGTWAERAGLGLARKGEDRGMSTRVFIR